MYLKTIEVQGFKSFANKIKFEFHNGITGIVGPNGSGKSNVADAVRWVLGEQRIKQLRGGSMQDVIFSGTETRKPLSYASVAITLDNSDHILPIDYKEVTITRRLYRSGESEYLINGTICRLKDVNELFYDTGIGREGYSIIGQGQIDKILSGKPEDRRELFDEAAGIVKFKRRKDFSLKKLEEERFNLARIYDILQELEMQLGPLEEQSNTAKEYLKKKESLRIFDINMFLLENARLKEQIQELNRNLENATNELEISQKKYDEMKLDYENVEDEMEAIEVSIERSKDQLSDTRMLTQQLVGQIEVLKEQINTARTNDEHYGSRLTSIQVEIDTRRLRRKELQEEQAKLQEDLRIKEKTDQEARQQLIEIQTKIAEQSAWIESNQNEIFELLNSRASTQAKMQHYKTSSEQLTLRLDELMKLREVEVAEATEAQQELKTYETELHQVQEIISGLNQQVEINEKTIEGFQKELIQMQEQLRIGQSAYHRESSRLESLKNITERYDGYGNSIRQVMSNKNTEAGLLGVVADIISTEKMYELAIETALGGSIQTIVTDNDETAKRMIAYLKKNKFGRATFLPLTNCHEQSTFNNKRALQEKGVLGLAHTLVTVGEGYQGLAMQLLGRTLVVDNIEHATVIARKYNHSLRIVTPEGELIHPGGSMTGGAFKNSSNLLSRRREIEEFEKTVLLLKKEMDEMERKLEEVKEKRAACYQETDQIHQELREVSVVENTAKMNLEQVQRTQLAATKRLEQQQQESINLEKQLEEIRAHQISLQVEVETSEMLENERNSEIITLQESLAKARELEAIQLKQAEEANLSFAGMKHQHNFTLENVTRIEEELSRYGKDLEELITSKGHGSTEIQEKEKKIDDLKATIEDSKELVAEIEVEIQKQTTQKDELGKRNKGFLTKRDEFSKHMTELEKECLRLQNRRESCEEGIDNQINYMWEEYELTYNRAMELRDAKLTDLGYMKRQIQKLRGGIRDLGDVNVNAIEEFKNISERYEFLKAQHDDLVEAEATLLQIVEELDAAMRKQFDEQFKMISAEYDSVFKQLFGGGKGTLELIEDEDILEAGIRIIAQPPGKKLQNMMQLSGGEKALTAIALLFAIQNLKPSPFCLLDEIEAALDDNNVIRFAKYLSKLAQSTQFIVITHRRGTMTTADRLYGITMQEKGVSTLVSVNLLENELT